MVKYTKFKEIVHLTFNGYDDLFRGNNSSLSLRHPLSVANGATEDTKILRWNFTPMNDVILSNYARIVLECVNMPSNITITGNNAFTLASPYTFRTPSITTNKSFDSANGGTNSLLIFYNETQQNSVSYWLNTHPDMLFNYSVEKSFLQSGTFELIITYPLTTTGAPPTILSNGFDHLTFTLLIYDIDEDLLLTQNTTEVKRDDYKKPQTYENNNIHTYGLDNYNKKKGF
jgi:hypothetical protein